MTVPFPFDPAAGGATLSLVEAAIRALHPGVPEIAAPELAARLAPGSGGAAPLILDVREAEEHAVSRIPGAILVPPGTPVAEVLARLEAGRPVVVACSVGLRSARMARALLDAGVPASRVANLRGGLFRWSRLGLPMEDDGGPTRAVHPYDALWGRLLTR